MATVNAVSSSTTSTAIARTTAQESEDRFLKLLVTQMKNQDPLNPLDNAEVTSQMAQLSTVTGIDKLNDTVKALSDSFAAGQSLQAAGLVGHGVMIEGDKLQLLDGLAFGGVELNQPVDSLVINVKDASGKVIHSVDLGAQGAGMAPFEWDGSTDSGTDAANGTYKFEIEAKLAGKKVDATALSLVQVASVSLGAQGIKLNVAGFDPISLSQIKQIL
ncbi:MAG: flagellar hook assembly protein FlgD [Sulfuricellaceae bacterium]|nr:flagellar hook assembly protein FlgD [Sulfuricellaceae bacterium]